MVRIAELEAEKSDLYDRLEKTQYLYEKAEAKLAEVKQELKELGHIGICRVCGNPCQTTGDVLPDLWLCAKCGREAWSHIIEAKMQAEAALAERDRMLEEGWRSMVDRMPDDACVPTIGSWLADLRARAEEPAP